MDESDSNTQPRNASVAVRVTRTEKGKIERIARFHDQSLSEYLHEKVVQVAIAEHDRLQEFTAKS